MKLCAFVFVVFFLALVLFNSSFQAEKTVATMSTSVYFPQQSNTPPTADFTYSPQDVAVNQLVHFFDGSSDSDGVIVSWFWEFGDGANATVTLREEANRTHTYDATGTYMARLTVVDNQSLSSSFEAQISVRRISTALSLDVPSSVGSADQAALVAVLSDEFGGYPSGVPVNFYVIEGQTESSVGVVYTDSLGRASMSYAPPNTGVFRIKAVFNGSDVHVGATSDVKDLQVGFDMVPYAVVLSVAVIVMSVVLHYIRVKRRKKEEEEPSAEEEDEGEQEEQA